MQTLVCFLITASLGMAVGAETISYEELVRRTHGRIEYQMVKIVTTGGTGHKAEFVSIGPEGMSLSHHNRSIQLRRDQISGIEFVRGKFHHYLLIALVSPVLPVYFFGNTFAMLPVWIGASAVLAGYAAGSTPVYLALDAVAHLIPRKVYKIAAAPQAQP